jgi:XTP/dITP diphosphohydrolase
VQSARYLGEQATYPERFDHILQQLLARPSAGRTARFVCALVVADGDTLLFETTGTIEGTIPERPAGTAGFGYDPIFFFPPYQRTLAEVTAEEKLAVAHRGKAFRALADWLAHQPTPEPLRPHASAS